MVTYLDKEAVLKAVKDAFSNPEHIVGLLMRIERGEFDATLNESALVSSCLADKDSEIARLNYLIAGYHEAIAVLRESKDQEIAQIKATMDSIILGLNGRIAELNDHIEQQDQELKDLGKALQYKCQMREAAEQKEPPKEEPELVICPEYKICGHIDPCPHAKPHVFEPFSCESPYCSAASGQVRCIPYKKEPPKAKDGSMDLPEGAKEIEKEICKQVTEAINSVPGACLEGEIRIEHIPSKATQEQKIPTHYACCDNVAQLGGVVDALEVDIGDLTLRMDLVDSQQAHDFRMITHLNEVLSIVGEFGSDRLYKIEERIGALEKKVK